QALGDELRAAGGCAAVYEHDELVAAEPRDRVGLAQRGRESRRDRTEETVTGFVAERVVHLFEAVEVDEQRGRLQVVTPRAGEHLLDAVEDERAVRKPGKGV